MPRDMSLKKVMVIGSGPIVIGQAAEFDYAGTQACRALKEEGIEVVLVNSNPATIMTDKAMADRVYIEPLTLPVLKKIIERERPDLILMDIILPDGSGLALCRQVREKQPDSCVVFLTGNDQEADMLKGYEAGGADYVTKPFSMAVLTR